MQDVQGFPLYYDITKPEAPQHICEFLKSKFGGVDIMVHNAGITRDKTLKRMKPENFRQVVDVNLNVVMRLNTALGLDGGKKCLVRKGGRVVLMASINGIAGAYGQTNYSLTKAGLIGYAHAMAPLIADKGITINSIAPGIPSVFFFFFNSK